MVLDISKITFGVDLASHQGVLSIDQWVALHENHGICFAICKATGETNYFNGTYFPNRDNVTLANEALGYRAIQWGSYDWMEPSMAGRMSGKEAAQDYLRSIGERGPGHLLMVDFESDIWSKGPLGTDIEDYCRDYFMTLSEESQQMVGVYFGPYFMSETGGRNWGWLGDPNRFYCWLAAPGPDAQAEDNVNWPGDSLAAPFQKTIIHQHQWHTHFSEVPGTEWDKNRFQGTPQDLWVYGKQGGGAVVDTQEQVQLPPEGRWSNGITENGVPYIIWNFGGRTRRWDGVAIKDMGGTVESFTEPGMLIDRSIKDNEVLDFNPPRPRIS